MAYTERIVLNEPLSGAFAEELQRRLFFVSEDIVDFDVRVRENLIREIAVTTLQKVDTARLADKIHFIIANDIVKQKVLPGKVIWRSDQTRDYQTDVFERLVERNMAFEAAEGQVCLGEPLIRLMDWFDGKLKNLAASLLDAQEYRYPTLIPTRVLKECGYFDSFPHMLMFVTRLHNDVDTYRAFQAEYQAKNAVGPFTLAHCGNLDYCLPPTMCYHTYHQLRNTQWTEGQDRVITSKGKSFRYESRYHRTLERLWDFTIREIVFLGSGDYVLDCRRKFMTAALDFIAGLGLAGWCEVASDPFFCTSETAAKTFSQKLLELKYELRLNLQAARSVAVASFNFHDQFFGERFNLRRKDGAWIRTGCVGFGLERLVFAFVSQYGLDEKNWPAGIA